MKTEKEKKQIFRKCLMISNSKNDVKESVPKKCVWFESESHLITENNNRNKHFFIKNLFKKKKKY